MGQTGSRVVGKLANSFSFNGTSETNGLDGTTLSIPKFRGGTPLVYTRRGSMYFDEDGDLAHEFYEEIPSRRGIPARMRKITKKHLRPQGEVKYSNPRLHVDFPIILYQG
ncbi:hypothetical protein TCAL_07333 [Tigriopus californicus]|uniref:Tumor suppressor candidate 2 n=1 Tax=Tigriopus californicus TaxID=6832 RepID=A0A553NX44_TIGCA|nr:tumor suppressor candidate 2-like [Tigriopus californicus]TRY70002.1 hypothetical protein TCAL_07333 [Tigriopus californicus]|eukprot:TCALIF_07333-PA protein Name:"Similar to TUSC2 Tumor suppressor candidate 2 (Homo sapiens)" AED:0.01 eAED:0.01 QI:102/1/1/1/1/1/2/305/109